MSKKVSKTTNAGNNANLLLAAGWHSVNELLPEIGETILSYSPDEGIRQTKYTTYTKGSIGYAEGRKDCWFEWITHNDYCWRHKATHWMKMPVLPACS